MISNDSYNPSPKMEKPYDHSLKAASNQASISSSEGKAQGKFLDTLIANVKQQGVDVKPETQDSDQRIVTYKGQKMTVQTMLMDMYVKNQWAKQKSPPPDAKLQHAETMGIGVNIKSERDCVIL